MKNNNGKVYLVGAGPGDPGLITVKGVECIRRADVLIYDYLASPELLTHAPKKAELIYVGKTGGDHTLPQNEINSLIIQKAKAGLTVIRLKGGDPFIFGRGGEEAEALVEENIPFEVVPGITSAIAAPTYAGIPLTHRKFTSTVAFVTGHEDPTKKASSIHWKSIAEGIGTIVFLMGVKNLEHITRRLIDCGMPPSTPVALVRWGTTPKQMTVKGTLETITEAVKKAGLSAPAVIVVGKVVELADTLAWFETRPLLGRRIVVTRARDQASDLVRLLSDLGAECFEAPTIKIVPPEDTEPLDKAIDRLSGYDWLIFTSANGVDFFFDRLLASGRDARALGGIKTAVIGPATEKRLRTFGVTSDIIPESYQAESIVKAFQAENIKGKRIVLPRATEARPVLPVELRKMGAFVDEIPAYKTEAVAENADILLGHLEQKTVDMITFTSSSTVKNFKAILPQNRFPDLLEGITIASIGPITTETAEQLGFTVHLTAETYTIDGLCDAIQRYYL